MRNSANHIQSNLEHHVSEIYQGIFDMSVNGHGMFGMSASDENIFDNFKHCRQ